MSNLIRLSSRATFSKSVGRQFDSGRDHQVTMRFSGFWKTAFFV